MNGAGDDNSSLAIDSEGPSVVRNFDGEGESRENRCYQEANQERIVHFREEKIIRGVIDYFGS